MYLNDQIGYVGFEGRYGFLLIRLHLRVKKPNKKSLTKLNCMISLGILIYLHISEVQSKCPKWEYNRNVQFSHTTCVMCVNFMYAWQDLQFKVDSE